VLRPTPGRPRTATAQRRGGSFGDRRHARVSLLGSKSRQLVNENEVPLSLHVVPACGVADASSVCPAADRAPPNGGTCVTEMRATVYLLPAEGNCWVSIWTRGGYIGRSWATMDQMHAPPRVGTRPDTPVEARTGEDVTPSTGAARFGPSRAWLSSGDEFSFPTICPVRRPATDLGTAVAAVRYIGDPPAGGTGGHPRVVWPRGAGGARNRLWAAAHPRWRWPKTSLMSM